MGEMNVAQPITLGGRKGEVSYFDDKLKLSDKETATIAKVIYDDGSVAFFNIKPK
jgi:hypothetical protein